MRVRQILSDPARCLDEGGTVAVMFLHAGRNGEDVGVEDDVSGRESALIAQSVVGALADGGLASECARLPLSVKPHHSPRRAVAAHGSGMIDKCRLPFL